ncbi:amino acid permease-domain-containing protein [Geranomyces variabilis]|nr:amino acid permease-domain-containing protein [Geranomyces variabilis]KAJ3133654.1 hypothetical protein HDU90_005732 [Geranomyces variabilis]
MPMPPNRPPSLLDAKSSQFSGTGHNDYDDDFDLDADHGFGDPNDFADFGAFGDDDQDLEDSINALLPARDRTTPTRPRRHSSATFELGNQFFIPLSRTLSNREAALPADLTFASALALIISLSIGSGIFSSPGLVLAHAGSVGAALGVWLIGGLLFPIMGGCCYAELGTMLPSSGGEHPYLMAAFGDLPAFLFSWTGATVTRPASVSIITLIAAEYTVRLMFYARPADEALPLWLVRTTAVVFIGILTTLNCVSTKAGTRVQNLLTVLKLLSLCLIGAIGIYKLGKGAVVSEGDSLFQHSSTSPVDYALALAPALWAYDGWNNVNLVAGELRNPTRDLPRAITIGPTIVIAAYLLANIAYYAVLPTSVITASHAIAMSFGKEVFGHSGAIVIPLVVIAATLGASNASIFTGARLAHVSARAGHLPSFLGNIHARHRTPFNALVAQSALSVLFVLVGDFKSLVNFYSMIAWVFYLLAVLALLVLRRKQPGLERPFRVWNSVAALFLASTVFLLVTGAAGAPGEAVGAAGFLASGVPAWYIVVRKKLGWEELGSRMVAPFRRLAERLPWVTVRPQGYTRSSSQEDGMEMQEG